MDHFGSEHFKAGLTFISFLWCVFLVKGGLITATHCWSKEVLLCVFLWQVELPATWVHTHMLRHVCEFIVLSGAWVCSTVRNCAVIHSTLTSPEVQLHPDASGSWGCGAVWGSAWFQVLWHRQVPHKFALSPISVKELLPIILATGIWGSHWRVLSGTMLEYVVLSGTVLEHAALSETVRCLHG